MTTLLESKYRVPVGRPDAVARPRLEKRLNAALRVPLTVLSAPAGFGKTTMLTAWLASFVDDRAHIGWLSLDARDNDPALFWTYVIAAIQAAVEGVGADAVRLLTSSFSVDTRIDPPLPLARMRARGQLLELRAADLRFTAEESAAYLNDAMGLGLADSDVDALDGGTEGWIAALQLAA